jgi:hypothetical protein
MLSNSGLSLLEIRITYLEKTGLEPSLQYPFRDCIGDNELLLMSIFIVIVAC